MYYDDIAALTCVFIILSVTNHGQGYPLHVLHYYYWDDCQNIHLKLQSIVLFKKVIAVILSAQAQALVHCLLTLKIAVISTFPIRCLITVVASTLPYIVPAHKIAHSVITCWNRHFNSWISSCRGFLTTIQFFLCVCNIF